MSGPRELYDAAVIVPPEAVENAIVAAADPITGWMSDSELRWLIREASRRRRIVEVGAFCGRTTLALALATPGTVTSVDPWIGEPQDYPDLVGEALYAAWQRNLAPHIASGKVTAFTGTLQDYARTRPARPDFVFVDGNHLPDFVVADCQTAKRLVAKGAVVAGHDWPHPGLTDAVRSVFPDAECVTDRVWVVQR